MAWSLVMAYPDVQSVPFGPDSPMRLCLANDQESRMV
jgi:hypothetical protein